MSTVPGTMLPPICAIAYWLPGVHVGLAVGVAVAGAVGVGVDVAVAVAVGVDVGVDVTVGLDVGVGVGVAHTTVRKAMSLRGPWPVLPMNVLAPVTGSMV